jgi:hypothetical protein
MTCVGKVERGAVVLPPEVKLPDGTEVVLTIPEKTPGSATFAERYKEFLGMADDLPADLARNLDHYLHGHPKK